MKKENRRKIALVLILATFVFYSAVKIFDPRAYVLAQTNASTPTPAASPSPEFNQPAAIAKLKEQIKGKENEPPKRSLKISKR